jgi:hypothetical protein
VDRPDTRALWNANAAAWTELSRAGFDFYRDLVNTPAFFAMLPPVEGLTSAPRPAKLPSCRGRCAIACVATHAMAHRRAGAREHLPWLPGPAGHLAGLSTPTTPFA